MKRAIVIVVNNALEHHVTLVYRTIFLGETMSLIEKNPEWRSEGYDTLIDKLTLTDLMEVFATEPQCVLICADVHHSRTAKSIAETARCMLPTVPIFAFGRATTFIPQFFSRAPFTAVHESGDREVAIAEYLRYLDGESIYPAGVRLVADGSHKQGRWSHESEWAFPALDRLPVNGYRDYVREVYGAHYTPRISATIGKGCSWGCEYCGATIEEGNRDRRRSPQSVVEWANEVQYLQHGFSLHMYHPNLFANAAWIRQLSDAYLASKSSFSWRGVTTTVTLRDSSLVDAAGRSGCTELAIGVETISVRDRRSAKSSLSAIELAAKNCNNAGIRLKALVMVGYPGQSNEDLEHAKSYLTGLGMTVRHTGYTPLQQLATLSVDELDSLSLDRYDRRTFYHDGALVERAKFYGTLIRNGGYEFPDFED